MSDAIYARIVTDFQNTMTAYGRPMTFTPREGAGITVRGFKRGLRPAELIGGYEQTDLVVTISAQGVADLPRKFDRMTIDGRPHSVMHAVPLMAGETTMGYKVFVRGGG